MAGDAIDNERWNFRDLCPRHPPGHLIIIARSVSVSSNSDNGWKELIIYSDSGTVPRNAVKFWCGDAPENKGGEGIDN